MTGLEEIGLAIQDIVDSPEGKSITGSDSAEQSHDIITDEEHSDNTFTTKDITEHPSVNISGTQTRKLLNYMEGFGYLDSERGGNAIVWSVTDLYPTKKDVERNRRDIWEVSEWSFEGPRYSERTVMLDKHVVPITKFDP